jgi:hypothetical protein
MNNAKKSVGWQVAPLILLIALGGLACGSTTSTNDGGGTGGGVGGASATGGSGNAGAKGTGGTAGAKAGTGGQGGATSGSGISTACETCAATNCSTQVFACASSSACEMCVTTDYNVCVSNQNAAYAAVCSCAKTPCPSCASYCP